jgi:hypothetical protein
MVVLPVPVSPTSNSVSFIVTPTMICSMTLTKLSTTKPLKKLFARGKSIDLPKKNDLSFGSNEYFEFW